MVLVFSTTFGILMIFLGTFISYHRHGGHVSLRHVAKKNKSNLKDLTGVDVILALLVDMLASDSWRKKNEIEFERFD